MKKIFKIGDKVIPNLKYDHEYGYSSWWNENRGKIMTISKFISKGNICEVYENTFWWPIQVLIKINNDFLKEEDFKV